MSAPNARRSPSVIDSAETKVDYTWLGNIKLWSNLLSDFPHENSVLCVLSTKGPNEKSWRRRNIFLDCVFKFYYQLNKSTDSL